MNRSVQIVKDKLKNVASKKGVKFNSVMRFYMFERFIERLANSEYKDNFILKGGFYLSILFGINSRSTLDIDAAIRKTKFSEENIVNMITEIININVNDNVKLSIEKVESIRDEDEYGGLRIFLSFKLDNIKDKFHLDIATGDPIYPGPNDYKYESLIDNKTFNVWSYSLETILAEKLETIFSKLETSSRMKDYYDVYLIYKLKLESLNKNNFRKAVEKTFKKRGFNDNLITNLNIIRGSSILKAKWVSYSRKNSYAKDIDFNEIIGCLEYFVSELIMVAF